MEGNKSKPRALLVFGAPCSGKSTFSEKFAEKFDLAIYDFEELKAKYRLTRKNILLIIKLIARTGKTIIIEGGLSTEKDREEIRNLLRAAGYEPSLIWIQTDVTTIRNRLKVRYKSVSKAKEVYDTEVSAMEAPSDFEEPIILSGKHTFETQTKHVLAGLAEVSR
ncbi:ATP-binding protein [Candidatus Saccharibacteria bacterium]|nr:ATP-binding protein [Candidatus Saccharibacteria bacterium]